MNKPLEDGYIECEECGHLVERHDEDGCQGVEGCTCRISWTRGEIRAARVREGLAATWID